MVLVTTAATVVDAPTTQVTTASVVLACSLVVLTEGHDSAADWASEASPVVHFWCSLLGASVAGVIQCAHYTPD